MNPRHTTYHPKWHRERMPIFWWLRRVNYAKFITRELTSVAVGYAALLLVCQVRAVATGPESLARLQEWLRQPAVLLLHAGLLVLLLIHTVTWLNLAPRAMVMRLGGRQVPDRAVLVGHYAAWLVTSVLVAWVLVGGRP